MRSSIRMLHGAHRVLLARDGALLLVLAPSQMFFVMVAEYAESAEFARSSYDAGTVGTAIEKITK